MKLSKTQALFLTKVLFHYENLVGESVSRSILDRVQDARADLNSFLVGDECDGDLDMDSGECAHCASSEVDEDVQDEEADEEDEADEEASDEEDDEEAEEDDEEGELCPKTSESIDKEELIELSTCSSSSGKIVFYVDDNLMGRPIHLAFGDASTITNIHTIRRRGKELDVWSTSSGAKPRTVSRVVYVSKFPKDWTALLEPGVVYEVE